MGIKKLLKGIPAVDGFYVRYKWRERKISPGTENQDKTFFVVRRATCKVGLFSYVMTSMGLVRQALELGYIPVIDMQGNANSYLEEEEIGRKNAWEFYFEQPCGYTLEDIRNSRNVILSSGLFTEANIYPGREITLDKELCQEWRAFFHKYLRVNREIRKEAEMLYHTLFEGKKVLGVLCRGTDYKNNRPANHPVQPETDMVIRKAREIMEFYNCERLYLATEDEEIYEKFEAAFGERLRVTEAERYGNTGHANINDLIIEGKRDRYRKGKEYLINILLLSMCSCLVAGSVGGTYGALLMSDGYEYEYVFDLGLY